jgi:lysophospholipase L1-like esterase
MCAQNQQKTIVCLGDSTTYGTYSSSPYPKQLQTLLPQYKIVNSGIPGDKTDAMIKRFANDVKSYNPKYVIIIGGTNDIIHDNATAKEVEANLSILYKLAIQNNIIPIACTIPPNGNQFNNLYDTKITDINKWIKNYSRVNGIIYIDIYTTFNDPAHPGYMYQRYTSDGLHPNAEGDKLIAGIICTEMRS